MTNQKKVKLDLCSVDGNAFFLLAAFSRAAKNAGWTADEIKAVTDEAKSSDYDHLVATLDAHCEAGDDDDD